jgi:hypothetical protein
MMPSGYCFEFTGKGNWRGSSDEKWDTEVYAPKGGETRAGEREIDGVMCCVFKCPDGIFRAVTTVSVR